MVRTGVTAKPSDKAKVTKTPKRPMIKFIQSLKTLEGWNDLFENLKWIVVLCYLQYLSDSENHFGFWAVVVIFLFEPSAKCITSIINKKRGN